MQQAVLWIYLCPKGDKLINKLQINPKSHSKFASSQMACLLDIKKVRDNSSLLIKVNRYHSDIEKNKISGNVDAHLSSGV